MIPAEVDNVLHVIRGALADSLVAVYLHGSAVAGGLRPSSDVDVLVVIDEPLDPGTRLHLTTALMEVSGHPARGSSLRPVELMIFLRTQLVADVYPARCEFIYGEWLRHEFEHGVIPQPAKDPELTLVLAQARQEAKPLLGPGAFELFPIVSQADIRRAIGDLLPDLVASLQGDERNVLLTLARMWRTLTEGDFVTKDAAASWAEPRLPAEHAAVLKEAREAYLGMHADDWSTRQEEVLRTVNALQHRIRDAQ
uniref:aminoglycoside adenylyltransferase family protein n=1 Tax=Halomonas sp. TaxID=1486246 RepID=UPI00260C4F2A|nr:aminoglycoside adenylyltransferase family protein [Halomonas sp.]